DGTEHVDTENYPNNSETDVNGPFQLRIFVRRGEPQGQRDGCCKDDELPTPEVHPAQEVTIHPGFEQPLQGIIRPHEDGIADEGKDHCIGMQWAHTPECGVLQFEVHERPYQLYGY